MRRFAVFPLVLALAACSGGARHHGSLRASQLSRLVLQSSDLPDYYDLAGAGRPVGNELREVDRTDPTRFGRKGAWSARFKQFAFSARPGPFEIHSRVDLFTSSRGAKKDFDAYRRTSETLLQLGQEQKSGFESANVGDEGFVNSVVDGTGSNATRYVLVVWRDRNVTASVNANGFVRKTTLGDVLEIARRQERHIAGTS